MRLSPMLERLLWHGLIVPVGRVSSWLGSFGAAVSAVEIGLIFFSAEDEQLTSSLSPTARRLLSVARHAQRTSACSSTTPRRGRR